MNPWSKNSLSWFAQIGYTIGLGPDIAPGDFNAERASFSHVILTGRLEDAIHCLNPQIPQEALRMCCGWNPQPLSRTIARSTKMLRDGVEVEYRRPDGSIAMIKFVCWISWILRPTTGLS